MPETFDERSLREHMEELVRQLINLGYQRKRLIRMVIAQGFGEKYATKVVDNVLDRLAEQYNGLC